MATDLLRISLFLSTAFGFFERTLLELQDCCIKGYEGIIIIIDRTNSDYTAMQSSDFSDFPAMPLNLENALRNATNPILVSKSCLKALIKKYKKDYAALLKNFIKEYLIKEVEDFYLIVPINWQSSLFSRGLKIESLGKDISWDEAENVNLIASTSRFTDILSRIFLTTVDKQKSDMTIEWMIFAAGHGFTDSSIIGLTLDEFKEFTEFMNKKISTKFFMYSTCFGGGLNRERGVKLYQAVPKESPSYNPDVSVSVKLTYPYYMVSHSSSEAISYALGKYEFKKLFSELVTYLKNKKNELLPLYLIFKDAGFCTWNGQPLLNNMPLVRLPNAEYFSPIPGGIFYKGDFITISGTEAKTRKKDLQINDDTIGLIISTVDPNEIYTEESPYTIPFKLDFEKINTHQAKIPRIMFFNVKNKWYKFANIYAPNLDFETFFAQFLPLSEGKRFDLIFELLVLKDGVFRNCSLSIKSQAPFGQYASGFEAQDEKDQLVKLEYVCIFKELEKEKPLLELKSKNIISAAHRVNFYLNPHSKFHVKPSTIENIEGIDPKDVCQAYGATYVSGSFAEADILCSCPYGKRLELPLTRNIFEKSFVVIPQDQEFYTISEAPLPSKPTQQECETMISGLNSKHGIYSFNSEALDKIASSHSKPGRYVCATKKVP